MECKDFYGVEDAWFWFCQIVEMRTQAGGLKKQREIATPRACDYHQMCTLIKEMQFLGLLTNKHLRIMGNWGKKYYSPLQDRRAKYSDKRIWEDAMYKLEFKMIEKGYLNAI